MSNATRLRPQLEIELRGQGFDLVVGIDEAGRGPLAGPVVASAVLLKSFEFTHPVRDSKKLSHLQREKAFAEISQKAHVGIGIISETIIDEVNILQATFMAMHQALRHLVAQLTLDGHGADPFCDRIFLLIDGNRYRPADDQRFRHRAIIDGDTKILSIACASIMAKVTRDRMMEAYDTIFPGYGFAGHKGYPTKSHREAIQRLGLSSIHRKTFARTFCN